MKLSQARCAALFLAIGIGTAMGVLWHTLVVRTWLVTLDGTMELVVAKVAELGHVLPRRTPTGEVLSVNVTVANQGVGDVTGAFTVGLYQSRASAPTTREVRTSTLAW